MCGAGRASGATRLAPVSEVCAGFPAVILSVCRRGFDLLLYWTTALPLFLDTVLNTDALVGSAAALQQRRRGAHALLSSPALALCHSPSRFCAQRRPATPSTFCCVLGDARDPCGGGVRQKTRAVRGAGEGHGRQQGAHLHVHQTHSRRPHRITARRRMARACDPWRQVAAGERLGAAGVPLRQGASHDRHGRRITRTGRQRHQGKTRHTLRTHTLLSCAV